jgi:MFS family permease
MPPGPGDISAICENILALASSILLESVSSAANRLLPRRGNRPATNVIRGDLPQFHAWLVREESAMTRTDTTPSSGRFPDQVVPEAEPRGTSTFVTGQFPRRRGLIILASAVAGFLLTAVWSAEFADRTVGDNVANTLLGHDARATPITGIAAGIAFAFVSGLAGTFTACNVAAFGAVAPLMGNAGGGWTRLVRTLKPLGWMSVGMTAVSATYGAVVGLVGTRMPQFSTASNAAGTLSPRSIQSMVVFGLIGLVMCYLGLAALGVVPDPFARIAKRFPNAPMIFMGVLIGGFLIGRPFALFRQLFRDAAESGNPLYGAAAFTLQSLGNIVIMAVLFLALAYFTGGRLQRWLAAKPSRIATVTAVALIVAGAFTFLYWDVRLLARRGIIPWYPMAPWS